MTKTYQKVEKKKRLDLDGDELLDVADAADEVGCSTVTIGKAIRSGELPATVPRGRAPTHAGRGQGYRIKRSDLQAWYFPGS